MEIFEDNATELKCRNTRDRKIAALHWTLKITVLISNQSNRPKLGNFKCSRKYLSTQHATAVSLLAWLVGDHFLLRDLGLTK
jgi:hypothetical protein